MKICNETLRIELWNDSKHEKYTRNKKVYFLRGEISFCSNLLYVRHNYQIKNKELGRKWIDFFPKILIIKISHKSNFNHLKINVANFPRTLKIIFVRRPSPTSYILLFYSWKWRMNAILTQFSPHWKSRSD